MSGETEKQVSGWTVDTLHGQMETLLDEREARYDRWASDHEHIAKLRDEAVRGLIANNDLRYQALHQGQKDAILKAEAATEKRFESVNEFRQTLADQANGFMPRSEAQVMLGALGEKLARVDSNVTEMRGAGRGAEKMWGFVLGGVGAGVGIAAFLMNALK